MKDEATGAFFNAATVELTAYDENDAEVPGHELGGNARRFASRHASQKERHANERRRDPRTP